MDRFIKTHSQGPNGPEYVYALFFVFVSLYLSPEARIEMQTSRSQSRNGGLVAQAQRHHCILHPRRQRQREGKREGKRDGTRGKHGKGKASWLNLELVAICCDVWNWFVDFTRPTRPAPGLKSESEFDESVGSSAKFMTRHACVFLFARRSTQWILAVDYVLNLTMVNH